MDLGLQLSTGNVVLVWLLYAGYSYIYPGLLDQLVDASIQHLQLIQVYASGNTIPTPELNIVLSGLLALTSSLPFQFYGVCIDTIC